MGLTLSSKLCKRYYSVKSISWTTLGFAYGLLTFIILAHPIGLVSISDMAMFILILAGLILSIITVLLTRIEKKCRETEKVI